MLYQVQVGESPATIAARFGIPMAQLIAANPSKPTQWINGVLTFMSIAPGESLNVPVSGPVQPAPPVVQQFEAPNPYTWDGRQWQLRQNWREERQAWFQRQQQPQSPQQPVFPQYGAPNPYAWDPARRQWLLRQQMPQRPADFRPTPAYGYRQPAAPAYHPYQQVRPPMGRRF